MTAKPAGRFVLHEHRSRHHHFDLRLEHEGTLASWAVPKGLPGETGGRNLAIRVEDHPLDYIGFEGTIPEGEYGAGTVTIADRGDYDLLEWDDDRITIVLHGTTFSGRFSLIRFRKAGENSWLIIRQRS